MNRIVLVLALTAFLASCNHTRPSTGPRAIGLVVSNVQLTGPSTISAAGGAETFTVTYDAKVESTYSVPSQNIIVRDQDLLPENIPVPGDDLLLTVAATGIPAAPSGNSTAEVYGATDTFTLFCAPTLVGLTVQGGAGNDSGEGGTNLFGSDAADIYVELQGQRSNVLLVSCAE